MHDGVIPLGGGLAILAGAVLPVFLLADHLGHPMRAILVGACLCAFVGFADDVYDLPVVGQARSPRSASRPCPVVAGVSIDHVTLPILDPFSTGFLQYPLTIIWIVGLMNVVNFVDGMDGLAAGRRRDLGRHVLRPRAVARTRPARAASSRRSRARASASCAATSIPRASSWATPAR